MAEVWRALGCYRLLVAVAFRCPWQYRTSLVLLTVAEVAATALDLAAIGIVFADVGRLAGFGFGPVSWNSRLARRDEMLPTDLAHAVSGAGRLPGRLTQTGVALPE